MTDKYRNYDYYGDYRGPDGSIDYSVPNIGTPSERGQTGDIDKSSSGIGNSLQTGSGNRAGSPAEATGTDIAKTADRMENTTLIEQRAPMVDDTRYGGAFTDARVPNQVSMPDSTWFAASLMRKAILINTFNWLASSARHSDIYTVEVPNILASLSNLQNQALSIFQFYRTDMILRFQLNSTKFHVGRVLVCFNPCNRFQFDPSLAAFSASCLPHVVLDASNSTVAELVIPFASIENYFQTLNNSTLDDLGTIHVVVLNQLQATDQQNNFVPISVWLRASNVELHVPIYPHTPVLTDSVTFNSPDTLYGPYYNDSGAHAQFLGDLLGGLSKIPLIGDFVSGGVNLAGNILSGNIVGAISSGADLVKGVTNVVSNLDRPVDSMQDASFRNVTIGALSHGSGVDSSTSLRLNAAGMTVHDPALVGSMKDEMNLLDMAKKPGILRIDNWTTALAEGSVISRTATNPLSSPYVAAPEVSPTVNKMQPTPVAFVANPFQYWRGGLRYKIEIVASQFHTGRIMLAYFPGILATDANLTYANAASLPNVVMDLQESTEYTFTVPYYSTRPWKVVSNSPFPVVGQTLDTCTGTLAVFVVNQLTAPTTVSNNVDINMWVMAADDFQVAVPAQPTVNTNTNPYATASARALVVLAPAVASEDGAHAQSDGVPVQQSTHTEVATSGDINRITKDELQVYAVPMLVHGEPFDDLKSILRRYNLVDVQFCVADNNMKRYAYAVSPISDGRLSGVGLVSSGFINQKVDLLTYFSRAFAFWRGSIRFKFVADFQVLLRDYVDIFHIPLDPQTNIPLFGQLSVLAASDPINVYDYSGMNLAHRMLVASRENSHEVQAPYYTYYNNSFTTQLTATGSDVLKREETAGHLVLQMQNGWSTATDFNVYKAAGDDFMLHYFMAPPIWYFDTTSS